MRHYLDFEKPLAELEAKINELRQYSQEDVSIEPELERLREKAVQMREKIFSGLNRWQRTQLARHPDRPYTLDYIRMIFTDWCEIHGDRLYGDDCAIVGGFARIDALPCAVIGHQKGRDTKEKIRNNFGMPHPEGYHKALRVMKLAEKFSLPIFTFIDTPGAFPGIGAEERGQAAAIAQNLYEMAGLTVPVIATITGEGGSGGALAIAVANRVLMMEYSVYSVISPEGCAAILWADDTKGPEAAEALKLTAQDIEALGDVIDGVIPEPAGGAHNDPEATATLVKKALLQHLKELSHLSGDELVQQRFDKFRAMTRMDALPA